MKSKNIIPVLVGAGQLVNRNPESAVEPIDYIKTCALKAEEDTGTGNILSKIDSLSVVNVISRNYVNGPIQLAEMLNAQPNDMVITPIGAAAPQSLTNRLCDRISKGESEIGLICGAEAFYSSKKFPPRTFSADVQIPSPSVTLFGDANPARSETEIKYGVSAPKTIYPLFANAFRKAQGLSMAESMQQNGRICAQYAKVAANNKYAWFRDGKDIATITSVTPQNRMIDYPYTKYMNAIMNVDQAAAVIIMSEEKADALGIAPEKRVYLVGCSDAYEKWLISNRVNYYSSPGLDIAFSNAFQQAGIEKNQVDFWDFYNCFPIPAQLAVKALDLDEETVPTVTGGLPYFGGPGNNYCLHSICSMMEQIRKKPEKKGLLHSLSWFMSKYAIGIYSGVKPDTFQRRDPEEYMHDVDKQFPDVDILDETTGAFEIETYTVTMNRDGEPESAVIIAKTDKNERLFALNDQDTSLMKAMTTEEPIGKKAKISYNQSSEKHLFSDIF